MGKRKRYKKDVKKEANEEKGSSNTVILAVSIIILISIGVFAIKGRDSNDSTTTKPQVFPDFVYTSGKSVEAYIIAEEMPEILEHMPCYCSCVRVGHKSLKDCFLTSIGSGYSKHGAYCNTCIYEALDVKKWHEEGLSLKEIRSRIDEKYGGGRFAEGTDTPAV